MWGLVNNAGVLHFGPIEWTPLDVFRRTADVNLWGMVDVTKTFLPLIKKARGRVVNLSSMAGKETHLGTVFSFVKSLTNENHALCTINALPSANEIPEFCIAREV